jgi:hypothetical protein
MHSQELPFAVDQATALLTNDVLLLTSRASQQAAATTTALNYISKADSEKSRNHAHDAISRFEVRAQRKRLRMGNLFWLDCHLEEVKS